MPTNLCQIDWGLNVTDEGAREYFIKWLIKADSYDDGPATIFATPGVYAVGAIWDINSEADPWVFCTPGGVVAPVLTEEPGLYWTFEQKFTSPKGGKRCQDSQVENPLDEPPKISGSFVKYQKQIWQDRDGNPLVSSSFERFKGSQVERDFNRPTVQIQMNVATAPLSAYGGLIDHVNDNTLWGVSAGCVKLSNVSWEKLYYGECSTYYTVTYEFDIDFEAFRRDIMDMGTKHLKPGGVATNPADFIQYKDKNDENATCLLNGSGVALGAAEEPYFFERYFYPETNLLVLDIPTSL